MHFILTIIEPHQIEKYGDILAQHRLSLSLELHGHGTASKSILNLLGLESKPKHALLTVASDETTDKFMKAIQRKLYIDAPGNGIAIAIPVKSVGGAKTLEFLNGREPFKPVPKKDTYESELIIVISNDGYSDAVMDAARSVGARGGTILHGKGTAKNELSRFYNVNITGEKEIVLIVAASSAKETIMTAILRACGPASEAGGVVFSLPVSRAMGMSIPEA